MSSLNTANSHSHKSRSNRVAAILSSIILVQNPKFSNSDCVELLFQGITQDPSLKTLSLANRAAANEEESVSTNLVSSVNETRFQPVSPRPRHSPNHLHFDSQYSQYLNTWLFSLELALNTNT